MKTSTNVLVFTLLTCGTVRSYGTYEDQNFAMEPLSYPQKYPRYERSPGDTTNKWDHGTYGYGLNHPPINDYSERKYRGHPKGIGRSHSHGHKYFGPEYDIRGHTGSRFEYPSYQRPITPQEDYWTARDSKNWSQDGEAFPYPDPERFKVSRLPFSPPESPLAITSSPLSQMKTRSCIKNCPSTPEYNPVCGTNGITYSNPGRLECAKYCGVDVALQMRLPCNQAPSSPPSSVTQPTTDTQSTTVAQPPTDTQPPKDTPPPVDTTKAPFESKPPNPPNFVGNDPFVDRLVFVSTESPNIPEEDFDIDIRSRDLKSDHEIVFEDY